MKCPYCNSEMEKGYIQSNDGLGWNRKKRLLAIFSASVADQELGRCLTAYRCEACEKIVIDYSIDADE